ncbi:MAG: hypothetical protein ACHREM_07850 [Polyangiales bacterium]
MWLQAAFTHQDIVSIAEKLFPVHLALQGEDRRGRHLYLGQPRTMELVAGVGLRAQMRARVRWPILGLDPPVNLSNVFVLLKIKVARHEGEDVFAFAPELERLDVASLPRGVDRALLHAINAELDKEYAALTWRFTHTLDFYVPIPEATQHPRRLHLAAKWGNVVVSKDGVTLVATFDAEVRQRHDDMPDSSARWADPARSNAQ